MDTALQKQREESFSHCAKGHAVFPQAVAELTSRICFLSFLSFLFYEAIQGYGHKIKSALQGGFTTGHHLEVSVLVLYLSLLFWLSKGRGRERINKELTEHWPVSSERQNDVCLGGKHDERQSHLGALGKGKQAKTHFRPTYRCIAFHSLIQVSFTWSLSSSFLGTSLELHTQHERSWSIFAWPLLTQMLAEQSSRIIALSDMTNTNAVASPCTAAKAHFPSFGSGRASGVTPGQGHHSIPLAPVGTKQPVFETAPVTLPFSFRIDQLILFRNSIFYFVFSEGHLALCTRLQGIISD